MKKIWLIVVISVLVVALVGVAIYFVTTTKKTEEKPSSSQSVLDSSSSKDELPIESSSHEVSVPSDNNDSKDPVFKEKIIGIPKDIKLLEYKDYMKEDINPVAKKIESKDKVDEILAIISSTNCKKLGDSWEIKSMPTKPYYSLGIKGDFEITLNFCGDLGKSGYMAVIKGSEVTRYEMSVDSYKNLLKAIK